MIGYLLVAVVLTATSYAAYLDLRTTEVPDTLAIVTAAAGLVFHAYTSIVSNSIDPFFSAVLIGTTFFAAGWLMYLAGMWGGADAFMLGAIGYAFPALPGDVTPLVAAPWPFPVSLLMTLLLAGSLYSILYAILLAIRRPAVFPACWERLVRDRDRLLLVLAAYTLVIFGLSWYLSTWAPRQLVLWYGAMAFFLFAGLLLLSRFLQAVEAVAMRRTVPVSELAVGDVLAADLELETPGRPADDPVESFTTYLGERVREVVPVLPRLTERKGTRFVGVTAEQVQELQERYDTVEVKAGVRFVPVFPVTVLVLVLVGDPLFLLLSGL